MTNPVRTSKFGAEPDIRSLGAGRLIALPPVEWREIIAEAERLGV